MTRAVSMARWECKSCASARIEPRKPADMPSWLTAPGARRRLAVWTPSWRPCKSDSPRRHKVHKYPQKRLSRNLRFSNESKLFLVPMLGVGTHVRTLCLIVALHFD